MATTGALSDGTFTQSLSTPSTSFPTAINGYSATPNGTGGVNYFQTVAGLNGGNPFPTTRELYQSNGYGDPGAVEAAALAAYKATQPSSALSTDTTGGTTGGTGTTGPTAASINAIATGEKNYIGQAGNTATQLADQPNSDLWNGGNGMLGILPTVANLRRGQAGVDNARIQDQLARTQGLNGVLQMVNHGIQSGGVQLANANASNSSAAEALARAYGIQGRDAASKVGNQYAQGENAANQKQLDQDTSVSNSMLTLKQNKADAINSIVNNANAQLVQLNATAMALGVSPVDIEAAKQQIRSDAMDKLSQYDAQLANTSIPAAAPGDIAAKANELATAGTAAAAPYNYTATGPAQFQNTGPTPSELPIYVSPTAKKQT